MRYATGLPATVRYILCVDMQRMFAEDTEWKMPWLERVLPNIVSITALHPDRTIFSRFIPAQHSGQGVGMWRHYYERWATMTVDKLGADMIVPELARFALQPATSTSMYSPCARRLEQQRPGPTAVERWNTTRHYHRRRNRRLRARNHDGRHRLGVPRHTRGGRSMQLGGRDP